MIEFRETGNLLVADVEALVNTVNTKGVMGKGIALQFKHAFPENYVQYRAACKIGEVQLGKMFVTYTGSPTNPRAIINFPTKGHWSSRSSIIDIAGGLQALRRFLIDDETRSVAIPKLGCGLGGLNWDDVRPSIEAALGDLDLRVVLFARR